jgi:hypothetical protein
MRPEVLIIFNIILFAISMAIGLYMLNLLANFLKAGTKAFQDYSSNYKS